MVCEKNIKAYACVNKKYEVRRRSTSGGIFYELASVVINKGGEVCAARFDDDFQVRHSFCRTEEQLYNFLGSKYVPSILDGIYQINNVCWNSMSSQCIIVIFEKKL